MILYLDTSAFVRLYVEEAHHEDVWNSARDASLVATHLIAYAEMRAAFAKMHRMKRLTVAELNKIKRAFEHDWQNTLHVQPTEMLIRRAGELAEQHGLRGYDSVHLAAAEALAHTSTPLPLVFAGFDATLNNAARKMGMALFGDN